MESNNFKNFYTETNNAEARRDDRCDAHNKTNYSGFSTRFSDTMTSGKSTLVPDQSATNIYGAGLRECYTGMPSVDTAVGTSPSQTVVQLNESCGSSPANIFLPLGGSFRASGFEKKEKTNDIFVASKTKQVYSNNSISVGDTKMSFVGITFYGKEIIAFSDSKSVRQLPDGHLEDCGTVRKLFCNDDFILVTSGTNSFPVDDNGKLTEVSLEALIDKEIGNCKSADQLTKWLFDYISENITQGIDNIHFIAAGRNKNGDIIRTDADMNHNSYSVKERIVGTRAFISAFSGATEMVDFFAKTSVLTTTDESAIRSEINKAIAIIAQRHSDDPFWCNPVGGDIVVRRF